MKLKKDITTLKQQDLYSLILFALFKLRDIPEYSSLSRLAYLLDEDSFLNLCEYFGGLTVKIPTIDDLESIVYSLTLYQYVNIDKMDYEEACKLIGHKSKDLRRVKTDYNNLVEILDKYTFTSKE